MAHLDHFPIKDVRNIMHEHERTAKNYKNDVDLERSCLNFGYGLQTADDVAIGMKARCADIMDGRKMPDNTTFSEWKATYPSTLCDEAKCMVWKTDKEGKKYQEEVTYHKPRSLEHVRKFFDVVWYFTVNRYGKDNVLGAYVHMDETTPHIHFVIIPEAISRKTGKLTVSSASKFTKKELFAYQRDLQDEMIKVFGDDAKEWILNGRTKGNYTIDELKERQRQETELSRKAESIMAWNEDVRRMIHDLNDDRKNFEAEKKDFEDEKQIFWQNAETDKQKAIDNAVADAVTRFENGTKTYLDGLTKQRKALEDDRQTFEAEKQTFWRKAEIEKQKAIAEAVTNKVKGIENDISSKYNDFNENCGTVATCAESIQALYDTELQMSLKSAKTPEAKQRVQDKHDHKKQAVTNITKQVDTAKETVKADTEAIRKTMQNAQRIAEAEAELNLKTDEDEDGYGKPKY